MSQPPSTDDILLDRAIQGTDGRRCVDWAIGMLMVGYDTDYLCRLAGQLPPFDLVSIATLRDRALEELGFEDLSNESLICCAVANSLKRHQDNERATRQILKTAEVLYETRGIRELESLFRLWNALEDLAQSEMQWYVHGMDRANASRVAQEIINDFVINHAKSP